MLPYDSIPEMIAPRYTVSTKPPPGYSRDLDMRTDAPFFNASSYCNKINLRFSLWLRHPATTALLRSFKDYYREAARELQPELIMQVKSGARCVHGYYIHIMLHDALSAWCDHMLQPDSQMRRVPISPHHQQDGTTNTAFPQAQVHVEETVRGVNATDDSTRVVISPSTTTVVFRTTTSHHLSGNTATTLSSPPSQNTMRDVLSRALDGIFTEDI